jgi:seryl-tRNA synthetase
MDTVIEERVDRVEIALERFIDEMGEFKEEMRAFKNESERDRKALHKEMMEFKDEMREFKDEMREFKEEAERDRKRMNKQWGELANKLGTIVEDIVAPSIPGVVKERFNVEIDDLMVRRKKKVEGLPEKEWDVIAVSPDTVFLNYTKSTLKPYDVDKFLDEIKIFRGYFPEYKNRGIIGVLASLYIDESVIKYAEKNGLLVLGIGEEIMEILNSKEFEPVRF